VFGGTWTFLIPRPPVRGKQDVCRYWIPREDRIAPCSLYADNEEDMTSLITRER
jgi:hypothetical protein